ncbi:MAG: methylated-DNA--[protein]-cysteine S-methyltransferase [Acidovorax sp.]|uniref:methylated-DNA--[protein]-cysteine S-methyltransferase n=1 Tax=Acidovorax sp. TaxID=1872122 RepID=UPI0025C03278|nr:methylated-DNA--[protein]-cysteine S-methyltransferase [Acidovorax sp.]MCE1192105.1 methylated-DNA--[protein]-cysteine S-methyltransferase [Acidovorax sp.]
MQFHPLTVQLRTITALGPVRLAASPVGLAGVWFEGQRHAPVALLAGSAAWALAASDHPVLAAAARQLQQYLQGERTDFDLPLDLSGGTAFQQEVWRALLAVGRGATTTYGALSRQLGRPLAVRAVGAAVGRNPLSVVVPCHRVLGADGSLTGYAGGLDRKTVLLSLENALPTRASRARPGSAAARPTPFPPSSPSSSSSPKDTHDHSRPAAGIALDC